MISGGSVSFPAAPIWWPQAKSNRYSPGSTAPRVTVLEPIFEPTLNVFMAKRAPPFGERSWIRSWTGQPVSNQRLADDFRSLSGGQVEGEVVSVALVHYFHTQVGAVDDIGPGANHTTLRIQDGLVEVEPVQVERHGADAQRGKPDANHRPRTQEEVPRKARMSDWVMLLGIAGNCRGSGGSGWGDVMVGENGLALAST